MSAESTRQEFLKAAGAAAAGVALLGLTGCEPTGRTGEASPSRSESSAPQREVLTFRSRPDLEPPAVEVSTPARDTADGYIFLAPKKGEAQAGPMIVDNRGNPVWFRPLPGGDYYRAMDFKSQSYQGEPVITWFEGKVEDGYGDGEYVILDGSYREAGRVRAAGGYGGDLHEFLITGRDTALITIYNTVSQDLTSVGGPEDGEVVEGIVQELDIETGGPLFEWRSLDHIALEESYERPEKDASLPFDYFHINSIDVDFDDNLLISARKTSAVYKIDRDTGEVIWRLDGKASDFEMNAKSKSVYQHDAMPRPDGTITIFDNGVYDDEPGRSRGMVIKLDQEEMSAELVHEYLHPEGVRAATQANMQTLANGNVFVGWGSEPIFSEFSADGELLFDAALRSGAESYRAFRFPWTGRPDDEPAVAAERGDGDEVTVYASYNGATEVAEWEVLAGPETDRLERVGSVPRDGFETAIEVRTVEPHVAVRARDRSGRALGTSEAVDAGA